MKKISVLAILFLFIGIVSASAQWSSRGSCKIEEAIVWNKTVHDFGQVKHNKPQKVVFELTNTCSIPILITKLKATCGCTATNYSRAPIMPNKKSQIEITFDAESKGVFNKTIYVYLNSETSEDTIELRVKGTVVN